jgi:hypothetical protein
MWAKPSSLNASSNVFGSRSPSFPRPKPLIQEIPVPETIESNDDDAWALWEDSVSFQDSQYPDDSKGVSVRGEISKTQDICVAVSDPFSSVSRNGN